jgi:hypothetical protein
MGENHSLPGVETSQETGTPPEDRQAEALQEEDTPQGINLRIKEVHPGTEDPQEMEGPQETSLETTEALLRTGGHPGTEGSLETEVMTPEVNLRTGETDPEATPQEERTPEAGGQTAEVNLGVEALLVTSIGGQASLPTGLVEEPTTPSPDQAGLTLPVGNLEERDLTLLRGPTR